MASSMQHPSFLVPRLALHTSPLPPSTPIPLRPASALTLRPAPTRLTSSPLPPASSASPLKQLLTLPPYPFANLHPQPSSPTLIPNPHPQPSPPTLTPSLTPYSNPNPHPLLYPLPERRIRFLACLSLDCLSSTSIASSAAPPSSSVDAGRGSRWVGRKRSS